MNEVIKPSKVSTTEPIGISDALVKKLEIVNVHVNLSQEVIITTEDKLRLCLLEHSKKIDRERGWIAPLGVLVAIILTLITATFRDVGLSKDTWLAMFIMAAILVFGWLAFSLWSAWKSKKVEDIISVLKKDSEAHKRQRLEAEELRILEASYGSGAPEKSIDVAMQLNALINEGKLSANASNALAGDPDPGAAKKLAIKYEHNGIVSTKSFNEGDDIILP